MQAYATAKIIAQEKAKEAAEQALSLLNGYLDFTGSGPNRKIIIIGAFINVAKYVYRDQTDHENSTDFEDIPVIKRLRIKRRELSKAAKITPPIIPHYCKSVSWNQALEVLEKLRLEADIKNLEYKLSTGYIRSRKRYDTGIAESLQRFLLLGFMVLMPPDRSRTFQELTVGRTLKFGSYKSNRFIMASEMSNLSDAMWYIHLLPEDYKTGKAYKEWWGQVPNVTFKDGKSFYQYIELWLTKYRSCLQPNHDFFFTRFTNKTPQKSHNINSIIKTIFLKFTVKPVTPKELRKMYVTYLKDTGASEAELEAAATWMHHSRYMQKMVYDAQEQQAKLAPIMALNERILTQAFNPQATRPHQFLHLDNPRFD